jgi:CxxC motif-containing protein
MRVVTTTMLCDDGEMVPVKTNGAIPKELIFECMKEINAAKATLPIKTGDVLIKNVLGCDVDVVATGNR